MVKKATLDPEDVQWANRTLSFAVRTLQGKIELSRTKGRIHTAMILRDELAQRGFWWQVKILDHWIHRAQGGEFDKP